MFSFIYVIVSERSHSFFFARGSVAPRDFVGQLNLIFILYDDYIYIYSGPNGFVYMVNR